MGFDTSMLKNVLEEFVDDIDEESFDLLEDRPRFAHAVCIVADDNGEICEASCIRQLDVQVMETKSAYLKSEWEDEEIQRALRELAHSRDLLETPRNSTYEPTSTVETTTCSKHSSYTSSSSTSTTRYEFPSMSRNRQTPSTKLNKI